MRQSPGNLTAVAPDTIRCKVTDVGFMPIPGPYDQTIAGLLSVQLPPGVQSGSEYTVVMRQVAGRTFKVLGTTEFRIRVGHAAELLPGKLHDLSVLRYVSDAIPAGDRWVPVFDRYLSELEDRIRAFGGDPDDAVPSPTGHPSGADGRPGDDDGDEHADVCISGRVGRLLYDCLGDFEGFELRRCDGNIRIPACERGIERVVLTACERNLMLTIHRHPADPDQQHFTLGCGPCTCCDHPHKPAPEPATSQRPTAPARRPETSPRRRPRSRPPDAGLGIIDVAHGPTQHGGHAKPSEPDHRDHVHGDHDHRDGEDDDHHHGPH
jgi:hypothetical protein